MEELLPIMSGLFMSRGSQSESDKNKGPPYQVFVLLWTVLYGLLGSSWYLSTQGDFSLLLTSLYVLLTLLLVVWTFMFGCCNMNIAALWLFMPLTGILYSIIVLLVSRSNHSGIIPILLLIPLLVWLKFAYYLNFRKIDIIPRYENENDADSDNETVSL